MLCTAHFHVTHMLLIVRLLHRTVWQKPRRRHWAEAPFSSIWSRSPVKRVRPCKCETCIIICSRPPICPNNVGSNYCQYLSYSCIRLLCLPSHFKRPVCPLIPSPSLYHGTSPRHKRTQQYECIFLSFREACARKVQRCTGIMQMMMQVYLTCCKAMILVSRVRVHKISKRYKKTNKWVAFRRNIPMVIAFVFSVLDKSPLRWLLLTIVFRQPSFLN